MPLKCVESFSPAGLQVLLASKDPSPCAAQLKSLGYLVTPAVSMKEAMDTISTARRANSLFDVALVDGQLGQEAQFKDILRELPTLLMSENPKPDEVMASIQMGVVEVLEMPLCPLKLKNIWQHTVRRMMIRTRSGTLLGRAVKRYGATRQASLGLNSISALQQQLELSPAPSHELHHSRVSDSLCQLSASLSMSEHTNEPEATHTPGAQGGKGQKRKSKEVARAAAACSNAQPMEGCSTPHATRTSSKRQSYSSAPPAAGAAMGDMAAKAGGTGTVLGMGLPAASGVPVSGVAPRMDPFMPLTEAMCSMPAGCGMGSPPPAWGSMGGLPAAGGLLPAGMVWGLPMNPHNMAPGITPPIFPPPATPPVPAMLMPQAPPFPALPQLPGCMGAMPMLPMPPMPSPLLMPPPFMGAPAGMPCQAPPLPMPMLAYAMCGMGESPCSPCPTTASDKSAQDVMMFSTDGFGAAMPQQPKMQRCESNSLLPSLEDLMADGAGPTGCGQQACGAAAAVDMELDLDMLSLGLPRNTSLEDLMIAAF